MRVVIGDESGIVNGFFNDTPAIVAGASIVIFKADSKVQKEHIEIQLSRYGKIE